MSSIDLPANNNSSSGKKVGVPRMLKHNLKIDMTPMVDLGFLLIAFFVITTELTKPTVMNLAMPADGPHTPLKNSMALSFLLGKNNTVYYYNGNLEEALQKNEIFHTSYFDKTGIRKIIIEKQKQLDADSLINKEGRDGLMLLIKPTNDASYKNIIDALDEATINVVKRYVVMKPSLAETAIVKQKE